MLLGLFFIVILLTLLLFLKFSMDFSFELNNFKLNYIVRLRFGSYYLAVPAKMTWKMERMLGKQTPTSLDDTLSNLQDVWDSLDRFLQEITFLQLDVLFGMGDPFWTALACGTIWSIVGSFITGLASSNRLQKEPEIKVEPDYTGLNLQVSFYCIFRFRLGHIIIREIKRLIEE